MMEVHIIIPIIIAGVMPIFCYLFHGLGKLDGEIKILTEQINEYERSK